MFSYYCKIEVTFKSSKNNITQFYFNKIEGRQKIAKNNPGTNMKII